jgi:hypothetical protein
MKKVKKQLILMIVFLGNSVFLHGLMRLRGFKTPGRSVTSGISPAAAVARSAAMKSRESFVDTGLDTSTWSGWFQSFFQKPQVQSQYFQSTRFAGRVPPLGSRSFSTTPIQRSSFWEGITSLFSAKSLHISMPKEIDDLLRKKHSEMAVAPNGTTFKRDAFNESDLDAAKEKLENMLRNDPQYKSSIIETSEKGFGFTPPGTKLYRLTILDKIIFVFLEGDYSPDFFVMHPSANALFYLNLIEYLVDLGAKVNPENYALYEYACTKYLMRSYKNLLLLENPLSLYGQEQEINIFRDILKKMGPVFGKIIPNFTSTMKKSQEELLDFERNLEEKRRAYKEEGYQWQYRYDKAASLLRKYIIEHPGEEKTVHDFIDQVEFNEKEYEAWKLNKNTESFRFHDFNDFFQEQQIDYQGEPIWELLPGLTATSPREAIAKAFRAFAKEYRPDLVPKDEATAEKIKKVIAAWDDYHEQLKKQKLKEQGKTIKE